MDIGNLKAFELNREAHKFDDVDKQRESHHHTIGEGENNAASGGLLKGTIDRVSSLEEAKLATQAWTDQSSVSTNLTSASVVDIGGLSITVPVEATTDVFLCHLDIGAVNNNNDAVEFYSYLNVNGVIQTGNTRQIDSTTGAIVLGASYTWLVTGIAAGNRIFKVQGNLSGAGSWSTAGLNCVLTVVKLNG